jgi:molybdopterin/thiamine biosynthesis adenylyltransferase/rhodanese-related sulfurtransferase
MGAMQLPPLVEPHGDLSPADVTRYSRHLLLPGIEADGQRRLAAARVLVVGAGGLGSPVLSYLAAAGVGTIGVVDDDVVDSTNLQRQIVHRQADVGRAKTDSAAEAVERANPGVVVVRHHLHLGEDNAEELLAGYHLVVDGSDTFDTRYVVSDATSAAGIPCVWGSVLRFEGQMSTFWSAAPDGHALTLRDVFPGPPEPGTVPSCSEAGVLGAVCGVVGSVMAAEVVKLVCGLGEPLLGRLLVLDALTMSWSELPVRRAPDRPDLRRTTRRVPARAPSGDAATISAIDLSSWLAERERGERAFRLVDVREPLEHALVAIPGDELVPMAALEPTSLLGSSPVVFYCKSGQRSADACRQLVRAGGEAFTLDGGVLAWIHDLRPDLPSY